MSGPLVNRDGLPRLLVVMGSGETSPTMVKTHRSLLERLGPPPVPAVVLDTPFGFQANADDLAARAVRYFRDSVGAEISVATFRSAVETDALATEAMLAELRSARYVFAGPGSPTYALRQWGGTPVPEALADKLAGGGCVTFASAAALTLGVATVPVYEIYKVGLDPHWEDGLDLLAAVGLSAAVIPHYDNAEGGTHDTRYCYLGEARLARMEHELADGAFILGVDEHTGLVFDVGAGTAAVVGRGAVTVRSAGRSTAIPSGTTVTIEELRSSASKGRLTGAGDRVASAGTGDIRRARGPSPFLDEIHRLEAAFAVAVQERDVATAVSAALDLDTLVVDWSRDTLQSDHADRARAMLRSMVVRLGELAVVGARHPRQAVAPFVDALLAIREQARRSGDWATADAVRDRLVGTGVEVRDTPEGTEWGLLS